MRNPFAVITPEELSAQQADQLFVEMYSDFPEITREGNTIITGARGCGKSMLIRCSQPDVQMIRENKHFEELQYVAINVPIKRTSLNLQELKKLNDNHAPFLLNEHFFALHVSMCAFLSLSKINYTQTLYNKDEYQMFYEKVYLRYLRLTGCTTVPTPDYSSANSFFKSLYEHLEILTFEFPQYLLKLFTIKDEDYSYSSSLFSFERFIVPVFREVMLLNNFPKGKPLFIFIDDADNLSEIQTKILNTWLLCRTQPTISLKISSQIGLYKTYLTNNDVLIESPHDYQDVNISYLYTTTAGDFYKKSVDILKKRLDLCNISVDPTNFFPSDKEQDEKIEQERERIRNSSITRGNRKDDDVRRYAIPNYIRDLGGTRKSRMTYKYAGLSNITNLSSGIIRYLLDSCAKMYDKASDNGKNKILEIKPSIQNDVMRERANFYLYTELKKAERDIGTESPESTDSGIAITQSPHNLTDKLGNLINAMGKTFHDILVSGTHDDLSSGRSERTVFSIALSNPNTPDPEITQVFNLGIRLGFFHESTIGNKDGNGRTLLYVLNRCLAPIFTLDPTGFQGYLFMTNADLKKAIMDGKQLREIGDSESDENIGLKQLTLFDLEVR